MGTKGKKNTFSQWKNIPFPERLRGKVKKKGRRLRKWIRIMNWNERGKLMMV